MWIVFTIVVTACIYESASACLLTLICLASSVGVLMLLYGSLPHILLVAIAPYIDPAYTLGRFGHAHGVKPGKHSNIIKALVTESA